MSTDKDDPVLRIHKSRREEAKRDAEMLLEIRKKQLESRKVINDSRIIFNEKLNNIRNRKKP
jgi:hypothetical protein